MSPEPAMNINNLLKNPEVKILPLVGNKYFENTPNTKDKRLFLERDYSNKHDPHAILVKSKRHKNSVSLGFISKYHNQDICSKITHYKIVCLLKKKENGQKYYYIACQYSKYPLS